eukprot:maker-scaffold105_size367834-snap-gene-2.46 protein:Tk10192 transcript:maker-scaffold105_size367834-snap-gene-2.46-mRNA-1 annotation:"PREDICTED: alpha-N-acetylglucosaminidase-like"
MGHAKYLIIILLVQLSRVQTQRAAWEEITPQTSNEEQAKQVLGLLKRVIPQDGLPFDIEIDPSMSPPNQNLVQVRTSWRLQGSGNHTRISVQASNGVSATWGIHHYLKTYLRFYLAWDDIKIELPQELPPADFTLVSNGKFQYYENVCTFGYTFAFWKWEDWERHIDWMALNGINLPLAFTAQEAIWERVYGQYNITELDLQDYFAGPAFLPWNRMGNLDGWGGPLTQGWHNFTLELQHQILERMRGLGMTPVLPAFAGHVPSALVAMFPNETYFEQEWHNFGITKFLDPRSALFQEVGKAFMDEYAYEFGTDHVYNCDLFNEMDPPSSDREFLQEIAKSVYSGMAQSDPQAVWLMQGWMFMSDFWNNPRIEAFLSGVSMGNLVILDLDSTERRVYERTNSYFGYPFIFNNLFNFGGNIFMYGRIKVLNEELFKALNMPHSSMIGVGLTPEGLADNHLNVDLTLELAWRPSPVANISDWITFYMARRYHGYNEKVDQAWNIIGNTVLSANASNFPIGGTFITNFPEIIPQYQDKWYNDTDLNKAWDLMMTASASLGHDSNFRYDLIDITRQNIENFLPFYHMQCINAFWDKDPKKLTYASQRFNHLLMDLDRLLATDPRFMLGTWLEQAKALGNTDFEKKLFEFNARNQVTLWGPTGNVLDYAGKQWSGLIKEYYALRWMMFWDFLKSSIMKVAPFEHSLFFKSFMDLIATPFVQSRRSFPTKPNEDTIKVAEMIYSRWRNEFRYFKPVNWSIEDNGTRDFFIPYQMEFELEF